MFAVCAMSTALTALMALTGCASSPDVSRGGPTTSLPATTTVAPEVTPTSVDGIVFDPCSAVPMNVLSEFGVVADAPKPYRTEGGKSTMVGCTFYAPGSASKFYITIAKNWQSTAVFRANVVYPTNEDAVVNGRESVQFRASDQGECDIAVPLPVGSAVIGWANTDFSLYLPDVDSCPQALELARAVEPYLPKVN